MAEEQPSESLVEQRVHREVKGIARRQDKNKPGDASTSSSRRGNVEKSSTVTDGYYEAREKIFAEEAPQQQVNQVVSTGKRPEKVNTVTDDADYKRSHVANRHTVEDYQDYQRGPIPRGMQLGVNGPVVMMPTVPNMVPIPAKGVSNQPSQPPSGPSGKKLHPCIAQHGSCKYGASCKYLTVPADVCLHWLNGRCMFSDKDCRYQHGYEKNPTVGQQTVPAPQIQPAVVQPTLQQPNTVQPGVVMMPGVMGQPGMMGYAPVIPGAQPTITPQPPWGQPQLRQ